VVEQIRKEGGRAFAVQARLGRHGDAAALWAAFDALIAQHSPLRSVDIIVNNAGIGHSSDLSSLTEEGFDEVFAVNVRAPFFIVQEGLKRMHDGGRIINISSGVARIAMPEIIAYGATKGALENFTLNLAKELGPRGITVIRWPLGSSTPTSTRHGYAAIQRPRLTRRRCTHWPSWPARGHR